MVEFSQPTGPRFHANPADLIDEIPSPEQVQQNSENVVPIQDLGASIPEGRQFGSFIQGIQNFIRKGGRDVELATAMGGGAETQGAENYGKDARQAIRELAKANDVRVVSIHTPSNIGNMSGYQGPQQGFSDEFRKQELDEVKKAVDFSADTGGGAVVIHTGEYARDISDQKWAKDKRTGELLFTGYTEEPGKAVRYMVDDRTGRLNTEVRRNQVVKEPKYKTKFDPNQNRERWVDQNGNFLDEGDTNSLFRRVPVWDTNEKRFEVDDVTWDDFERRAEQYNKWNLKPGERQLTPEDMFARSQMTNRVLQARGASLFHGQQYDDLERNRKALLEALDRYKKLEGKVPPEEQWKLFQEDRGKYEMARYGQQFIPTEHVLPSKIIKERIDDLELQMRHIHESSASSDANAEETELLMKHTVPVEVFAKNKTSRSYAEAGIYALERTNQSKHVERDIFIAPENIFPEMGYGSHPEELKDLVLDARKEMVNLMTKRTIPDPGERRTKDGELIEVANPHFNPHVSKEEAEKYAAKHIRSTFDTQHLGMWWKHFQPKQGETKEDTWKRFEGWYMDQVKMLADNDIIGHVHAVDAPGAGHHHLPIGQGNLPVRKALELLKKKDAYSSMVSEGYGEDQWFGAGRQLTESWKGLGAPLRGGYGPSMQVPFSDVQHGYFGQTHSPYFVFGGYSPSQEWQLWSQVQLE